MLKTLKETFGIHNFRMHHNVKPNCRVQEIFHKISQKREHPEEPTVWNTKVTEKHDDLQLY